MVKTILNVAWKEIIQLKRDRRVFPILFIAPVIQIILLGLAATLEVKHIRWVLIPGKTPAATLQIEKVLAEGETFHSLGMIDSYNNALKLFESDRIDAAVVADNPPLILVDASNANSARIIAGYLKKALSPIEFPIRVSYTLPMRADLRVHVLYNETLESKNFMVPGVMVTILMVMTMVLTALSMVREKERGTIEQVVTTPIGRTAFIAGKIVPYVIIGLAEAGLILAVAVFLLKVPFRGSVVTLLLFALLFMLNTLGAGMFFSVISRTQQQAMLTIFMTIMPMVILSGFIFPIDSMPTFYQWLAQINPFTHFVKASRYIFLRGSVFSELTHEAIALATTGTILFSLAVIFFRKQI